MPTKIAIICTLDELLPYSLADTANRYFSLHVSVGLQGDAVLPGAAAPLFQPWLLAAVTPVVYASTGNLGAPPAGQILNSTAVTEFKKTLDATVPVAAIRTSLGSWLGQRYTAAVNASTLPYFTWADDPTVAGHPPGENWSRVLAHASTYTAPIPQILNLAFHFMLTAKDLQTNHITRLFVAPTLTIDGTTSYSLAAAPDTPGAQSASWQYQSAPAGFAGMAAYQAEFQLPTLPTVLPTPHFIDLNTFWVGTESGVDQTTNPPQESAASEDWRTALEFRAAEEFDLGQRMIVALRGLFFPPPADPAAPPPDPYKPIDGAHPTFAEVDVMRDAVLAALRDTADYGLRFGPDGTNLIRFLFQRLPVQPTPDPEPIEAALLALPAMVNSDWANFIKNATGIVPTVSAAIQDQIGKSDPAKTPATGPYVRATLDMLDAVQKALATDSILAQLLLAQWNSALDKTPEWIADLQNAVSSLLLSLSSSRALRTRMLLANMGGVAQSPPTTVPPAPITVDPTVPIWLALIATTPGAKSNYLSETTEITTNLQQLLAAYFQGRFGLASTDTKAAFFANRAPQAKWPQITPQGAQSPQANPDLAPLLVQDATSFAQTILFPSTAKATSPTQALPPQPARASHPILLQVGDTSDDPKTAPNQDVERKIAGLGLLVRENSGPWTCANFANLYIADFGTSPVAFTNHIDNLPVPLRLGKRNQLKQPILSYNSASLVGQDDSDPASADFPQASALPPASGQDWSQFFQFRLDASQTLHPPVFVSDDGHGQFSLTIPPYSAPADQLQDWMRIPALKFGSTYSLLPFVIGNGGVLPPELASDADPFTPVTPSQFAANWQQKGRQGYLRQVVYRRRVGVGAPHMPPPDPDSPQNTVTLPAYPATVVPLARDFQQDRQNQTPILLLWGDPNAPISGVTVPAFTFQLRPPSCDLETWDRWVAGLTEPAGTPSDSTYRKTRIAVRTAIALGTLKSTGETAIVPGQKPPAAPDLSIDDPAVVSLTFTLTPVYTLTAPPAIHPTTVPVAGPAPLGQIAGPAADVIKTLMKPVQSNRIPVTCTIGATATLSPASPIQITIPSGEIWRLDVTANLNPADVQQKFEGQAVTPEGKTFSLMLEAATDSLFSPTANPTAFQEALWQNLAVAFDSTSRQLTANLNRWSDPATNHARDLMRKIDLRRQDWRWMGRPLGTLPADFAAPTPATLDADPPANLTMPQNSRLWEIASFAERSDDDCAVTTTSLSFAADPPPPAAAHALPPPPNLLSLDLSREPRAQFYRLGIDVHSRYEGLPGLSLTTVRARKSNADTRDNGYTRWRRALKPPAIVGTIPKPKVLMVIPLTEPRENGQTAVLPDLLVIANEPWFSHGGLAEELHAQLDLARDPSIPLSVPIQSANPIPELGPNPILSTLGQDGLQFDGAKTALPAEPIGTTFDLDTNAPLFGNTCFRLSASMLLSNAGGSFQGVLPTQGLEHFHAQVSFTRVIRAIAFGGPADLLSDPTDSFAVEFQPSFDHCLIAGSATPVPFRELNFSIAANAFAITQNGAPVTLQAGPPQSPRLELWALVMQWITDAAGQLQKQTLAVGFFALDAPIPLPDSGDLVLYIVEVLCTDASQGKFKQSGGGIPLAAKMLFGDPADPNRLTTDAQARIQRVSPPITHAK